MSTINFLPNKESKEDKKKVRTIEYTTPEQKQKKSKSSLHGGVLSIFKKRDAFPEAPATILPLPSKPGEKKQNIESEIQSHDEKKKLLAKTIISYQKHKQTEQKQEKEKKDNWLTRFFSRKEKREILQKKVGGILPPPPPPIHTEEKKKPEAEKKPEQKQFDRPAYSRKDKDITSAGFSVPPPFNVFNQTSQSAPTPPEEKKPVERKVSQEQTQVQAPPKPIPEPIEKAQVPETTFTDVQVEGGPRTRGMSFDVNLVPDELVQRKQTMSRLTMLAVVLVVTVFLNLVVYGILSFYKSNVVDNVISTKSEISKVLNQIDTLTPIQRDALVLEKKTAEISKLLDTQIHWVELFLKLEAYTHSGVTITDLSANEDGSVQLKMDAIDMATAYEQLDVFKQATDFVTVVEMTSAPNIPVESKSTSEGISVSNILLAEPNTVVPGGVATTKTSFALTLILIPELLTSK